MISSSSPPFGLGLTKPVGDVGAESIEGGSDNSGEELMDRVWLDAVAMLSDLLIL
jgi:hypothetical protein